MLNEEKREYFRMKENLPIEFREIEEGDFDAIRRRMLFNSRRLSLNELKNESQEKSYIQTILFCFELIDRKLDAVLELMEEKSKERPYLKCISTIDVSASGIRFISPRKPEKRYLEMVMFLPGLYPPDIRTIAEVVRFKKIDSFWEVAVRYVEITEEDRDHLISYLLGREREMIRKSRADG